MKIECRFNLFEEGRKYTGHHRKYILENARKACYAPETREAMRLRELLGYLGHGRREIARKLAVSEVEIIKGPTGAPLLVENVPSNVTTALEIDDNGNVTHTQEIMNTEPGKVVKALNESRVGGFSWACGGSDGGAMGATKITEIQGFDYVMNPGFALNRGYILESAGDGGKVHDLILESICKSAGIKEGKAEGYLQYWAATEHVRAIEMQGHLEEAAILESALRDDLAAARRELEALKNGKASQSLREQMIFEAAKKSPVVVPDKVVKAIISMAGEDDFNTLVGFFESAKTVNISGLPIGESRAIYLSKTTETKKQDVHFGRANSAPEFSDPNTLI